MLVEASDEPGNGRRVTVVGLGNLGGALSLRLLERGWDVGVVDTRDAAVDAVVARGGRDRRWATIADPLVLLVVPGPAEVEQVAHTRLRELPDDAVVLVHSTLTPQALTDLRDLLGPGIEVVDAPVSGGPERARAGELSVFLGASDRGRELAAPVLADIANHVVDLGEPGAGTVAKLAHQVALFGSLAALLEALALGEAAGVDETALREALSVGLADSWLVRNPAFFDEVFADYERSGAPNHLRPWRKDLVEAQEVASAPIRTAAVAAEIVDGMLRRRARQRAEVSE